MSKLKQFVHAIFWAFKNRRDIDEFQKVKEAMIYGPITYYTDGLATCINCDFIDDDKFKISYQAAVNTNPWPGFTLQWRVYIVCYFADLVKELQGDFVECGVNTGAYAKAVINYVKFNDLQKTFFLLDTFDGLVSNQLKENERKAGLENYLSQYKNVYESVVETFKEDNVNIIKGAVPDTLPKCNATQIAFLSIDMNCVEPEIAAMEYFYDKVVIGGVIIIDDYGFPQHIEQKKAHDAFALKKGINILALPTGQGVIIKK